MSNSRILRDIKITKVMSEKPGWRVTVVMTGRTPEIFIDKIEDLTSYRRFNNQCAKQQNFTIDFDSRMSEREWLTIVNDALESRKEEN